MQTHTNSSLGSDPTTRLRESVAESGLRSQAPGALLIAILTTTVICIASDSAALRLSLSVPELVRVNDGFWLNCSHEHKLTGADQIYAIKWFKDNEEFFRFLPNERPQLSFFETPGLQVDVSNSAHSTPFLPAPTRPVYHSLQQRAHDISIACNPIRDGARAHFAWPPTRHAP